MINFPYYSKDLREMKQIQNRSKKKMTACELHKGIFQKEQTQIVRKFCIKMNLPERADTNCK